MDFRKLIVLGTCALFLAGATAPSYAESSLSLDAQHNAAKPDAKAEKAKKEKVDAKAKLKAEAAAKAKAKAEAKAKADKEKQIAKAKADKEKQVAKAKAEKEKLAAKAKAEKEVQLAKAKAEKEKLAAAKAEARKAEQLAKAEAKKEEQLAKAKAEKDRQLAKAKAIEDKRLAKLAAEKAVRDAELRELAKLEVTKSGNNGELRSEPVETKQPSLFAGLFGAKPKVSMLAETRALDAVLEQADAKKKFKVKAEFEPQMVEFSGYDRGTIVIDTNERFLYLMESSNRARRYAIAVGKDGLQYKGKVTVGDKQEWPRWIPTKEMQQRDPKKYGQYKDGMAGGKENPLGARAIYLYDGKKDTHLRIHGTNQPQSIGTSASNGCFRMINEHVMDLYGRVKMGTNVVVL